MIENLKEVFSKEMLLIFMETKHQEREKDHTIYKR